MTSPATRRIRKVLGATFREYPLKATKSKIRPEAINIRYQTKGRASKLINFPNTAVKPQINTIKWSCR
jgi:hypothetical protein